MVAAGRAWGVESVARSSAPAAAVQASTSPVVPVPEPENPFALELKYNRDARVELNYRRRWDFHDVGRILPMVGGWIRDPFGAVFGTTRNITQGARIRLYGLSVRPSKIIVRESVLRRKENGEEGDYDETRTRLSLTPLIHDLQKELRYDMVQETFDLTVPQGRDLDFSQKEAVLRDLLYLNASVGVPVVDQPLKFVLNESTPIATRGPDDTTKISSAAADALTKPARTPTISPR